jgi:hypothetical protein
MKKYVVRCWIQTEEDNEQTFNDTDEAQKELERQEFLFPENIYRIIEVGEDEVIIN